MVLLENLIMADASFRICSSRAQTGEITALCSIDHPLDGGIVFIKSRKYFNRLLGRLGQGAPLTEKIGVIFQEAFLKRDGIAGQVGLFDRFRFYGTVKSVDLALSRFSKLFNDRSLAADGADADTDGRKTGSASVHPSSRIAHNVFLGEGVTVGRNVRIHPGCVILAHCVIGDDTVIYPNVAVYSGVTIGRDCIIHANTTIGSDGFSFNVNQGAHLKVWHCGGVVIGDSVEIGANAAIDQGTFSPTVIGEGCKIDNQVHIAHNCVLGKGVIMCGKSALAGSVTVGDFVTIGGAVNVAPEVTIGKFARIAGMSGVTGHVPERAEYGGHPARPIKEWLRAAAKLRALSAKRNRSAMADGTGAL